MNAQQNTTSIRKLNIVSNLMQDTPEHIKELQLKIWLFKMPSERLQQFIKDNDALFKFWMKQKSKS